MAAAEWPSARLDPPVSIGGKGSPSARSKPAHWPIQSFGLPLGFKEVYPRERRSRQTRDLANRGPRIISFMRAGTVCPGAARPARAGPPKGTSLPFAAGRYACVTLVPGAGSATGANHPRPVCFCAPPRESISNADACRAQMDL